MSRPLRIEFPDAWYHVMNRGRRAEDIFLDDEDYNTFFDLLKESVDLWNVRIAAYCLMPNHYHILVQTPGANLSRCMRHIDGVYTQRFNRFHRFDGQIFRGRFKSILVDADSYLLQLMKYIHRNSLRMRMVNKLDSYPWSSHQGYVSKAKKWDWLHKDFILSMLSEDGKQQPRMYRQFVAQEDSEEIFRIFEKKKWPSILGTEIFIEWVKDRFFDQKRHLEVPESRILAPDREKIKQFVCRTYQVKEEELLKSKRGTFNEPRNVAIYLTRQLRGENLNKICREYGLKKYSSASSVIERVREQIIRDLKFKKRIAELKRILVKSQTET